MDNLKNMNPFIRDVVLPLFLRLYRRCGPVASGQLALQLGYARRTVYNWMKALAEAGFAKLVGKRWKAVRKAI